jgi:hypothetical protein
VTKTNDSAEVYCIEGELSILNSTGYENIQVATLKTGQGAELIDDGSFEQVKIPEDKWWEDEFYKSEQDGMIELFEEYKYYIYAGLVVFILLIFMNILFRRKRNKRKNR